MKSVWTSLWISCGKDGKSRGQLWAPEGAQKSYPQNREKHKLVAEGAGVLSLAALAKLPFQGKKVVSIISGGNIDISTISALIDKALIARGRVFCFAVQLPDKPGQLLNVSRILAEENANVIKLDHDQTKVTDSFKKVVLTVTVETHNEQHIQKIIKALNANGYEIQKIY